METEDSYEIDCLINELIDCIITPVRMKRLLELVEGDPRALDRCCQFITLHLLIMDSVQSAAVQEAPLASEPFLACGINAALP